MRIGLLFILICFWSCHEIGFKEDTGDSPKEVFQSFWEEFDKHYSFFEMKKINWDSIYDQHINTINAFNLFPVLKEIALSFKDGHVNIYSDEEVITYNYLEGFPLNQPTFAIRYLNQTKTPNNNLSFSRIGETGISYLRIFSFDGEKVNFEKIDEILQGINDSKGLIIDLRNNGGGRERNAMIVASRFSDKSRLFRKTRIRNGPGHTDFSAWKDEYTQQSSGTLFNETPIVILTNRATYSAAEYFVLSMSVLPNVSVVGGVTGGGSGNPLIRELSNGWYFRLSHYNVKTAKDEMYEEVGLQPDHLVRISEEDEILLRDAILEKAMELIQ